MNKRMERSRLVGYTLVLVFLAVFIHQLLVTDLFIPNSLPNFRRILTAAVTPRLDEVTLGNMLSGYLNTILFTVNGFFAGIFIGLLLSYFSSRFKRTGVIGTAIAVVFRAAHEVVFMYILVLIFGLNPFIAIMAIGVSFGGIMSKVFTDNMNLTTDKSYLAYQNRGFRFLGNFWFYLFPTTFNSNINYVVHRFECAMRSVVTLSFIGLQGIGMHINHAMVDADYQALFAYVYSFIIFIFLFAHLAAWLLDKLQYRIGLFIKWAVPLSLISASIFLAIHFRQFLNLFQMRNWEGIVRSGEAILHVINPFNREFFYWDNLLPFWTATVDTVILGILGTVFLVILFTLLTLHYFYGFTKGSKFHLAINTTISVVSRSVPDMVFMVLLLFVMRANLVTGAVALALHNFGILTRLMKDRLRGNYMKTFTAYKNRQFNGMNTFVFVFLPMMSKEVVNLLTYRFEMMVKASVVIGILGGGGLGLLLRLEMSRFNFEAIYFIVILYVILFLIIDKINGIISVDNNLKSEVECCAISPQKSLISYLPFKKKEV